MDYVQTIIRMLDLIEDELDNEELGTPLLAKSLFVSEPHLQRAFHILTGMTLSEYIRNRRMTVAANTLLKSEISVIDLALSLGYSTPEAFSKAFKRFHGISPLRAKHPSVHLSACPRLTLSIHLKGDEIMNYKIVEKEAFTLVGTSIEVSTKENENFRAIPDFWTRSNSDGTTQKIASLPGIQALAGVCMAEDKDAETFVYAIAALIAAPKEAPAEYSTWEVPAHTWAVFESIGPMPDAIQEVWQKIFSEWFPATGFEHAMAPELEIYPPGDVTSPDYRCEVWIPIVKKGTSH